MTRGSIREYAEAVRGRYLRATKKEKGGILEAIQLEAIRAIDFSIILCIIRLPIYLMLRS